MTYPDCDPFPAGANDESAKTVNSERVDGCSFCGKVYRRPKVFVVLRYWRRCLNLIEVIWVVPQRRMQCLVLFELTVREEHPGFSELFSPTQHVQTCSVFGHVWW